MKYAKFKDDPKPQKHRIDARQEFESSNVLKYNLWGKLVSTNEKKINADVLNCLRCCWHYLRNELYLLSRHAQSDGSVKIWTGFNVKGKISLYFTKSKMNTFDYQYIHGIFSHT